MNRSSNDTKDYTRMVARSTGKLPCCHKRGPPFAIDANAPQSQITCSACANDTFACASIKIFPKFSRPPPRQQNLLGCPPLEEEQQAAKIMRQPLSCTYHLSSFFSLCSSVVLLSSALPRSRTSSGGLSSMSSDSSLMPVHFGSPSGTSTTR